MALDENKSYIAEQVLATAVNNVCSGGTKDVIEGADICYDAKVASKISKKIEKLSFRGVFLY
jgi:hypothetical protein